MEKPTIQIEKTVLDWIIEIITLLILVAGFIYAGLMYIELPETIPTHFGADGFPDAFGNKSSILVILPTWILTYMALVLSPRWPYFINYPFKISTENEEKHYQNAYLMIRIINLVTTILVGSILVKNIQIGMGDETNLGKIPLVMIIVILISLSIFMYRGMQINRS